MPSSFPRAKSSPFFLDPFNHPHSASLLYGYGLNRAAHRRHLENTIERSVRGDAACVILLRPRRPLRSFSIPPASTGPLSLPRLPVNHQLPPCMIDASRGYRFGLVASLARPDSLSRPCLQIQRAVVVPYRRRPCNRRRSTSIRAPGRYRIHTIRDAILTCAPKLT